MGRSDPDIRLKFFVIPGRVKRVRAKRGPMGASPESITTIGGYGFRGASNGFARSAARWARARNP
jgi:hypothetical protein